MSVEVPRGPLLGVLADVVAARIVDRALLLLRR